MESAPCRPYKYSSIESLQKRIDEYFIVTDKAKEPYTITGFCLFIDTVRSDLYIVEEMGEDFSFAIKKAKEKIANYLEKNTIAGKVNPAAGIFFSKNHGFTDQQNMKIEHSGSVNLMDLAAKLDKDKENNDS